MAAFGSLGISPWVLIRYMSQPPQDGGTKRLFIPAIICAAALRGL